MHITKALTVLAAVALLLTGPVVAQQTTPGLSGGTKSPADKAMMVGMDKMQHDMSAAPVTGDADKDFVAMMIPHHQGAIEMAKVELQYGKDPTMRKLATAIVAAQNEEIAEMRQWQANHSAQ